MPKHHGKEGIVKVSDDDVMNVSKFTITESVDTSDTTEMKAPAETHLAGIPKWSGSIDAFYNPADTTGQVVLAIGASVELGLYTDGDAVAKKYMSGTATVTSKSVEASFNGAVTVSFNFQGNGALAHSTVSA